MARRIKENPMVHRCRISKVAGELFEKQGIEATSMKQIADEAGYSKATLYVYFKNKEEIIAYLVLNSMIKLKEYIENALSSKKDFFEKYMDICRSLVLYEEEYPFYFSTVLDYINVNFENSEFEEPERETFRVGEEINELLAGFFAVGEEQGIIKEQDNIKAFIFEIWGMISGVITLSTKKKTYIKQEIDLTKKEFLERGFVLLYDAIKK